MDTGFFDFDELLLNVVKNKPYPVLVDVDFGHTEPMLTLPIGVLARLVSNVEPKIEILESAVLDEYESSHLEPR